MSGPQATLIGSGALIGLGVFLLLRAVLVVEQPRLTDALARLDGRSPATSALSPPRTADRWERAAGRAGTWAAARLPAVGPRAPAQALALIGWTPQGYAARKVGLAAFGLVFVPLLPEVAASRGPMLGKARSDPRLWPAPERQHLLAQPATLEAADVFVIGRDWIAGDQASAHR